VTATRKGKALERNDTNIYKYVSPTHNHQHTNTNTKKEREGGREIREREARNTSINWMIFFGGKGWTSTIQLANCRFVKKNMDLHSIFSLNPNLTRKWK
jgi:hypothetical protein